MSTLSDQQQPTPDSPEPSATDAEAVAGQLVVLVEEFESALSEGRVPPAFAKRLAELRGAADRLI